jgi:hypothetical protein
MSDHSLQHYGILNIYKDISELTAIT